MMPGRLPKIIWPPSRVRPSCCTLSVALHAVAFKVLEASSVSDGFAAQPCVRQCSQKTVNATSSRGRQGIRKMKVLYIYKGGPRSRHCIHIYTKEGGSRSRQGLRQNKSHTHISFLHIYEGGSMSRHCIWAVRKTQGNQQVLTFKANQWSASTLEKQPTRKQSRKAAK